MPDRIGHGRGSLGLRGGQSSNAWPNSVLVNTSAAQVTTQITTRIAARATATAPVAVTTRATTTAPGAVTTRVTTTSSGAGQGVGRDEPA